MSYQRPKHGGKKKKERRRDKPTGGTRTESLCGIAGGGNGVSKKANYLKPASGGGGKPGKGVEKNPG